MPQTIISNVVRTNILREAKFFFGFTNIHNIS